MPLSPCARARKPSAVSCTPACPMATISCARATAAPISGSASTHSWKNASPNGRGHNMIDSHHHFWWTARHTYHWPDQVGDRFARDFTPDDLRPELKRCGIEGTVLVQVLHQVAGETEECLDLCEEVDFVGGVVGWLPLADPHATSQAIDRLRGRGGKLVGVRHLISYEPDPRWVLQDGVVESLKLLASAGLVFDAIPVNAAQFESVLEVAQRLPELKIVLNH